MKKQYTKPKIVYESFALSASIAAGCSLLSTPLAAYICAVQDPEFGMSIFSSSGICDYTPPGEFDEICYDVPLAGRNVFSS
ncbi:MAG: hypothetical protein SOX69_00715 [Oscillospiraceae bacterium]|nr:hypothetical protein [Oscillospiraceae bacterium]